MTRGKYETLLDQSLWDYIDQVNAAYPPDMVDLPIEQQRAFYDAMARTFHAGRPEGVLIADGAVTLPDRAIPIRRYRMQGASPQAITVYYHGGGFVLGDLDSHDDICAELCAGTGFDVVSVDYRLAPEHVHPAAFEDARGAFEWVADAAELPIVLCGESAGGSLAAAVSHAARSRLARPAGQVLIYPSLGGDETTGSYVEHREAPLLTLQDLDFYRRIRTGGVPPPCDPAFEPLCDCDFSGLPPTVVVTAECDPLSSDGEAYCQRIVSAGGRAWWREEPRLVHSFLRARQTVPRARDAFARIIGAVAALGKGERPISISQASS